MKHWGQERSCIEDSSNCISGPPSRGPDVIRNSLFPGWMRASLVAQMGKSLPAMQETQFFFFFFFILGDPVWSLGQKDGNGNPLQYSYLENPMDWGAWRATLHGVAKRQARLRDWYTDTHCGGSVTRTLLVTRASRESTETSLNAWT